MRLYDTDGGIKVIRWAGRLIVFFGTAHTLGALTALGAGRHAGAWFSQELWREDLSDMSPAMSAYWLSVNSFGPPLILVGLTVLWVNRRGITPPPFIAWAMAGWVVVGTVLAGPGVGQDLILLAAAGLLLAASRRAKRRDNPAPHVGSTRSPQGFTKRPASPNPPRSTPTAGESSAMRSRGEVPR